MTNDARDARELFERARFAAQSLERRRAVLERMRATEKLLPCPFCGGEAELRYHPRSMRDPQCRAWEVGCSLCSARVGCTIYAIGNTRYDAIAAWNRRADHD